MIRVLNWWWTVGWVVIGDGMRLLGNWVIELTLGGLIWHLTLRYTDLFRIYLNVVTRLLAAVGRQCEILKSLRLRACQVKKKWEFPVGRINYILFMGSLWEAYCFLIVSCLPPLHYTIHFIIQSSTLHKTYWWVRIGSLYIQVDYPGIFDNWKITLGQKRSFLCYVYHTKPFPGLSTQGTLAKSKNNTGLCVATAFRELSPLLVNSASPFLVTIWWFDFCAPD